MRKYIMIIFLQHFTALPTSMNKTALRHFQLTWRLSWQCVLQCRSISSFSCPDTPQGLLPDSRTRTLRRVAAVPWIPERLTHSLHCAFLSWRKWRETGLYVWTGISRSLKGLILMRLNKCSTGWYTQELLGVMAEFPKALHMNKVFHCKLFYICIG